MKNIILTIPMIFVLEFISEKVAVFGIALQSIEDGESHFLTINR